MNELLILRLSFAFGKLLVHVLNDSLSDLVLGAKIRLAYPGWVLSEHRGIWSDLQIAGVPRLFLPIAKRISGLRIGR